MDDPGYRKAATIRLRECLGGPFDGAAVPHLGCDALALYWPFTDGCGCRRVQRHLYRFCRTAEPAAPEMWRRGVFVWMGPLEPLQA